MKPNTKKFLVVGALALALVAGIATGSQGSKAPIKDGSNVVYESEYGQLSAREYYKLMVDNQQELVIYSKFEKDVLSSFEKDKETVESAQARTKMAKENLDEENMKKMDDELRTMGYDGIDELQLFYENMIYRDRVASTYVQENLDALFPNYEKEHKPRLVSHILIKVEDTDNVTTEEQAKLDSIKKRILDGEDFKTVAKEVSDDNSKEAGGYLGLMDKNTPFITSFLEAALAQEAGQIYDWVPSEYGFHLILVDSTESEQLKLETDLPMLIVSAEAQVSVTVMTKIIQDSGIEFVDKDFEKKILDIMGGSN